MNIIGIETSCDDTCVSIVKDGRTVLSNCAASSAEEQNIYGGVVPEIASRRHIEYMSDVANSALLKAGMSLGDIDAVGVTFAPGLIGALLVGVNFAKGLAYSIQKPLVPVHHLRGHIASLYITHKDLKPPFLCLVVSGGHSHIVMVLDYTRFKVLGRTLDDAAGEAFDKVARVLGLGYPGGPAVSKAAATGNKDAYKLPTPNTANPYDVSFSGLKTSVMNTANKLKMQGQDINVADMAASFEHRATAILAEKLLMCAKDTQSKKICVAGGVSANGQLRKLVQSGAKSLGAQFYLPHMEYCTDNAAMIASQAYYEYENGNVADYSLNGVPTLEIDYI